MAQGEETGIAVEKIHGNGGKCINRTLLQNRHQHVHGVCGLDLLIEEEDKRQEEKNNENRKPVLFMVCFRHASTLLKPCPSASHRRVPSV